MAAESRDTSRVLRGLRVFAAISIAFPSNILYRRVGRKSGLSSGWERINNDIPGKCVDRGRGDSRRLPAKSVYVRLDFRKVQAESSLSILLPGFSATLALEVAQHGQHLDRSLCILGGWLISVVFLQEVVVPLCPLVPSVVPFLQRVAVQFRLGDLTRVGASHKLMQSSNLCLQ